MDVPLFDNGIFYAVKWELLVDRSDAVRLKHHDQWVQPARSTHLAALWVRCRSAAEMESGSAFSWRWDPQLEANPFAVSAGTATTHI